MKLNLRPLNQIERASCVRYKSAQPFFAAGSLSTARATAHRSALESTAVTVNVRGSYGQHISRIGANAGG